jgi:hypothetical protein
MRGYLVPSEFLDPHFLPACEFALCFARDFRGTLIFAFAPNIVMPQPFRRLIQYFCARFTMNMAWVFKSRP